MSQPQTDNPIQLDPAELARLRRKRRKQRSQGVSLAVSFAPMIDMSFLLLIFFLVTTTFERAEGTLSAKMPKDRGRPSVALPLSPIIIRVKQTGASHEDVTVTVDRFSKQPGRVADLAQVLRTIQEQPGFDTDTPVVIVATGQVRWDHIVGCWNAALAAGHKRIAFADQP